MKFILQADERLLMQGSGRYIKPGLHDVAGTACLTTRRFVFCRTQGAPYGSLLGTFGEAPTIVFAIPLLDLAGVTPLEQDPGSMAVLRTLWGDEYGVVLDVSGDWGALVSEQVRELRIMAQD